MRKGKRERAKLRQDYAFVKEAKRRVIAENLATKPVPVVFGYGMDNKPVSLGFRTSPDMRVGYSFNNPSNLGRQSRFGQDGTKWGAK